MCSQANLIRSAALAVASGVSTGGSCADVLRSLTSYIFGYTMLSRLRPGARGHEPQRNSFEYGLQMMMTTFA
jgi:hypothetical protein